jgi:hypothetical protein
MSCKYKYLEKPQGNAAIASPLDEDVTFASDVCTYSILLTEWASCTRSIARQPAGSGSRSRLRHLPGRLQLNYTSQYLERVCQNQYHMETSVVRSASMLTTAIKHSLRSTPSW